MALTPEDVRNKQFTPVRFREGYDEEEVDGFLDEVEAEADSFGQRERRPQSSVSGRFACQCRARAGFCSGPGPGARASRTSGGSGGDS